MKNMKQNSVTRVYSEGRPQNDGIGAAPFRLFRFGRYMRSMFDPKSTVMRAASCVITRDTGGIIYLLRFHVISRRSFRRFGEVDYVEHLAYDRVIADQ